VAILMEFPVGPFVRQLRKELDGAKI
jgi:hypothetical protein